MPKVSVILPIRNVQDYLPKAMDSLKAQTLDDSEFICVNNANTDNSLEISNEYAVSDKRFVVLNYGPIGIGAARNQGLKHASGEYVAFLDPDDTFEADALKKLYEQIHNQNADMIIFNYKKMNEKYKFCDEEGNPLGKTDIGKRTEDVYPLSAKKTFNWKNIKPRLFNEFMGAAWNKFYNRNFLNRNNVHFTEGCNRCEDCEFTLNSTLSAQRIGYNDEFLYNYMVRGNSETHTKKLSDDNFSILDVIDAVKKVLIEKGLIESLKEDFDKFARRQITNSYHRVADKDGFIKKCEERLSEKQIPDFTKIPQ